MLISRETRGWRDLTCPLSYTKGATSLWLEQPSSGRRIRRMLSPPSNPPLTRLRTRSPPGHEVPLPNLYQGQLTSVLNCSHYFCKVSCSAILCCLKETSPDPVVRSNFCLRRARYVLPKDEGISMRRDIPKWRYKGIPKWHKSALENWYTGKLKGVVSEIDKVRGQTQQINKKSDTSLGHAGKSSSAMKHRDY